MALDGITVSCIVRELNEKLQNGRIYKISQTESDELLMTVKSAGNTYRLLLSANASLPLLYLTDLNKPAPLTAPGFCMLLRKHLQNGRITSVTQPGLERIAVITIEHLNELGDVCTNYLITELMGKHSNIIFTDDSYTILDSIKHISSMVSSVREVLPGKPYFMVKTEDRLDPYSVSQTALSDALIHKAMPASRALYTTLTGFSPVMSEELLFRAGLDSDIPAAGFDEEGLKRLCEHFRALMDDVKTGNFTPCIIYEDKVPVEYSALPLSMYKDLESVSFSSISDVMEKYYAQKELYTRMHQKSADLRRILQTLIERTSKKFDLQKKQLKDTEKMDKYRIYGELINIYGYSVPEGSKSMTATDHYTGEEIRIPLDDTIPVLKNAARYFERYGKLKRTKEALTGLISETEAELKHLLSIQLSVDMARTEADLSEIKEEMTEAGYIKKHTRQTGRKKTVNRPLHYLSRDGYHMYVGKNNYQNDDLTFNMGTGNDLWFHSKKFPGSHVLVKTGGKTMNLVEDSVFEDAAALAAYYSKGRDQNKVEIDYVEKKHVKKPAGSKPGFVVYYTNYSMSAAPDISMLTPVED
ncbi:MAG: NFACT family protein [Lachnospiraceae bacterium]|nr:NFACT family protein [Lachnospiraceae bacterium]